jgi:hypothetical protein
MLRTFFVLMCFLAALSFACATPENANTSANQTGNAAAEQANLPPGFSTSPINTNGATTPGIPDPANANVTGKGATPTPGIPDPKTIGKTPMPKGTPPIPGIPDEETLKKQMTTPRNANEVNQPPAGTSQDNIQKSPIDRNRTASKSQ